MTKTEKGSNRSIVNPEGVEVPTASRQNIEDLQNAPITKKVEGMLSSLWGYAKTGLKLAESTVKQNRYNSDIYQPYKTPTGEKQIKGSLEIKKGREDDNRAIWTHMGVKMTPLTKEEAEAVVAKADKMIAATGVYKAAGAVVEGAKQGGEMAVQYAQKVDFYTPDGTPIMGPRPEVRSASTVGNLVDQNLGKPGSSRS